MAGVVVVDVGDVANDVVVGIIVACLVCELINYYFKK